MVSGIDIASGSIGLPDLDQHARGRPPIQVQHSAGDEDPLPERLARVLPSEVAVVRAYVDPAEDRARSVVKVDWQAHLWPFGRPVDVRPVGGVGDGWVDVCAASSHPVAQGRPRPDGVQPGSVRMAQRRL